MNPARLAWGLFALAALLIPVEPVVRAISDSEGSLLFSLSFAAVQLSMAAAGAVVASRLPRNAVGWILLGIGAGLALRQSIGAYSELGLYSTTGPLPGDDVAAWMTQWMFVPIIAGGVAFLLLLFPTGEFMSRRWKRAGVACAAMVLVVTFADALRPGPLNSIETVDNPLGAGGALAEIVGVADALIGPLALALFGIAAAAIVVRMRRSTGVERQQIKWITYTLTLVAVGLAGSAALPGPGPAQYLSLLLALFALTAMPVAAGVAVLRYRLYDIDVVINRTLVYAALTALLAGTYLGSILLLQLLLSGVTADNGLAIAGSTLAVAALFQPLRTRVQAGVDRRFFRRKYDATLTLERFAVHLRDEVDLDTLAGELRAVVADTMQPAHVSLWLRANRP